MVKDIQKAKDDTVSEDLESLENLIQKEGDKGSEPLKKLNVYEIFGSCCLVGFTSCSVLLFSALFLKTSNFGYNFGLVRSLFIFDTFMSGLCYFSYNLLSFMVLANVTAASHALLKNGKRISILIGAALFLHEILTLKLWFGVYLAVVGMLFYNLFKANGDKPVTKEIWSEGLRRLVLASCFIGLSILLTSF